MHDHEPLWRNFKHDKAATFMSRTSYKFHRLMRIDKPMASLQKCPARSHMEIAIRSCCQCLNSEFIAGII